MINRGLSYTFTILITLQWIAAPCWAVDLSSYSVLKNAKFSGNSGSEYVSGAQPGTVLMKVNIWGAVGRPGIHHVPTKTSLVDLLSYAGGPSPQAQLDGVFIKRDTGDRRKRIDINLEKIIRGEGSSSIPLQPNDIVVIEKDEPWIDSKTITVVSFISVVLSVALTGLIISEKSGD